MQTAISLKLNPQEYGDLQWVVKNQWQQLVAINENPDEGVTTRAGARARAARLSDIARMLGITHQELKDHGVQEL